LQWVAASLVTVFQILISDSIASYYGNPILSDLIKFMALSHIVYPLVTIRVFLLQRVNRLQYFGLASGACIAFENIFVAVMVFLTKDIMMIAYAKIAASIFWVLVFLPSIKSTNRARFDIDVSSRLLKYSSSMLGSELLKAFRYQADSLFAARLLSPEMFGLYSFAKSASVGIGQTLSAAFLSGMYPLLCGQFRAGNLKLMVRKTSAAVVFLSFLFVCQSLFAPFYITFLFDGRWDNALETASLLCLVSIPMLISDYLCSLFRVQSKVEVEFIYMILSSIIMIVSFLQFQPNEAKGIVDVMLLSGSGSVLMGCLMSYGLYKHQRTPVYTRV